MAQALSADGSKELAVAITDQQAEPVATPMGNIQMLGKSDAWQVKSQAPKVADWGPPPPYGFVAHHTLDFWLTSEDLPLPDSRVSLRRDGSVKLTVQPHNNTEALTRLRRTFEQMRSRLGMMPTFQRSLYLHKAFDVAATAHQAGTVRFGTNPETSALDINCKTHDLDNLYVVDSVHAIHRRGQPDPHHHRQRHPRRRTHRIPPRRLTRHQKGEPCPASGRRQPQIGPSR